MNRNGSFGIVMYSESLSYFSDRFKENQLCSISGEDLKNIPEPVDPIQPVAYVVSDSVKDVNFGNVFTDTFDVLPVVLGVVISFIAIRKGISYIRRLLVKS